MPIHYGSVRKKCKGCGQRAVQPRASVAYIEKISPALLWLTSLLFNTGTCASVVVSLGGANLEKGMPRTSAAYIA